MKMLNAGVPGALLRATPSGPTGPSKGGGQVIAIWVVRAGSALVSLMSPWPNEVANLIVTKCIRPPKWWGSSSAFSIAAGAYRARVGRAFDHDRGRHDPTLQKFDPAGQCEAGTGRLDGPGIRTAGATGKWPTRHRRKY